MKHIIFLLVILSGFSRLLAASPNYPEIFGQDFMKALNISLEIKAQVVKICKEMKADPELVLPPAFPELIRFSLFRDSMELFTLEVFYVNFGSGVNDFSVGMFQMKPSFVEQMENYLNTHDELKIYRPLFVYKFPNDPSAIRKERLDRLAKVEWQIRYLVLFSKIAEQVFPKQQGQTKAEMVKFYAGVYNTGFWKTKEQILKTMQLNIFPNGMSYPVEQNNYSDIALYFFENYWQKFLKDDTIKNFPLR
ncbi:MAG: hypothetical protein HPY53_07225 [Brevinematales bacterium]|nr:hypothetical protein [Brevinematales bacterium]